MWYELECRNPVIEAIKDENSVLFEHAWKALANMSEASYNKQSMWTSKEFFPAVIKAAQTGQPNSVRERALHVLANVATDTYVKSRMQKNLKFADAIDGCIVNGYPKLIMKAFEVFDSIATGCKEKDVHSWSLRKIASKWQIQQCRDAVITAAQQGQPEAERETALKTIAWMAFADGNQVSMWDNKECRDAVIGAAQQGQPEEVRKYALTAIANISAHDEKRVPMWQHEQCRNAVITAAQQDQPDAVREQALKAIANMALADGNQVSM